MLQQCQGGFLSDEKRLFTDLLTAWHGALRGAPARLARELKVEPATVSRWVNGDGPPAAELRPRVAKILGVSGATLLSACANQRAAGAASQVRDVGAMLERQSGYRFLEIPFLGVVRADRFSFSFDLPPENFTTLAIKGNAGDRYAMLKISGDCMAPTIDDGDEVLIRQTSSVEDGAIAIVYFDGECTMKRIYRKKDGVQLKADNKEYQPQLIPSNKVQVLAEVVKIIKDPRRKP